MLFTWGNGLAQDSYQPEVLARKFFEVRQANNQSIREFSWSTRTDVTRKDKVVDIQIEECRYGPEGKPECKIVNDQEARLPSSFLIHKIAVEEQQKMVEFMNELRVFLQQYALEGKERILDFFGRAKIIPQGSQGELIISGEDLIAKGDKMTWWVDRNSYTTTKAGISTIFQGEQVEFTATYTYVSPGIHYMTFAEIIVPSKTILVQIHSYDYKKAD